MLPGTLLGLFPGVIFEPWAAEPPTPKRGLRPYLKRHDGYWLDYEKELPYPMPAPGTNYTDLWHLHHELCEMKGITNKDFVAVPPEYINPYAVGHLINHPPPDTPANC